jgi:hypothetical protein
MDARRLRISVVIAVIVIAGFAQLLLQRVASSSTSNEAISWLAAGDSFASGAGLQHTTKGCARGTGLDGESSAWAIVAASRLNGEIAQTHKSMDSPTLVACTGAISDQFFNADGSPYDPEWTPSLHRYNLVTFSFGGDDIGFPSIVKHCAVGLCPPDQAVRQKISLLDSSGVYKGSELIPPYPTFLRHVATSAVTKGGNVVVMGYPEIFEDPSLVPSVGLCYLFTTGAMATARGWGGDLNATLGNAVAQVNALPGAQRNWVHFTFINPVTGQTSNGIALSNQYLFEPSKGIRHELCSSGNEPWLNGISRHLTNRSYHPNQAGEDAMGYLAAEVISKLTFPNPYPVTKPTPPPAATPPPTSGLAIGDHFAGNCVVAWPTAPVITQDAIIMTMSCTNVPENEYLFTQVQYGAPHLDITPDTGEVQVTGKVIGVETSDYGFKELVVLASNVKL